MDTFLMNGSHVTLNDGYSTLFQ
ncbi:hypothetical protein AZE42_05827 [Rhizopogon vesiculosus]|uniref:Uncharacterized protein n=1 Tax=Rhizopogon vesiculosus TaxID=180088 RepID=A0A1J8PVA6_9AGAM|nr:hypothetical protein AZE42_05827 [Rhizopogon vesiculosus]